LNGYGIICFFPKKKQIFIVDHLENFIKILLQILKKLKKILESSNKYSRLLWEPPKGRRNKNESSLVCAIREVEEESNIKYDLYQIIPDKKIKKQFMSNGTRYIIIYNVGILIDNNIPSHVTSKKQISEVSDVQWVPINKLNDYYMINDIRVIIKNISMTLKKERKGKKDIKQ